MAISEEKKEELKRETEKDSTLKRVIEYCRTEWPIHIKKLTEDAKPYWKMKDNLHVSDNLLFNIDNVVIPQTLRKMMLEKLHEGHVGGTKMKIRARQLMYWPGITSDIEEKVKGCNKCMEYSNINKKLPLIPHEVPKERFQNISADVLEYNSENYLVIMDAFSKWLEIIKLKNKTAGEIINKLTTIFAIHGIPEKLTADNMPFASREFHEFSKKWEFKITTTSPKHSQSNGLAEKAVGIAKRILKKSGTTTEEIQKALLHYRNSPVAGLKVSPSQILFSRQTRTLLPISREKLKPEIQTNIRDLLKQNQIKKKKNYDKTTTKNKEKSYDTSDDIYIYIERGEMAARNNHR